MREEESFLTWSDVQERLVEAVRLCWRSEGSGRWPFASDAPWHLLTARARTDSAMDAWRLEQDEAIARDAKPRRVALSADEVAERDRVLGWLPLVPERDRRLVVLAVKQLASGRSCVDWAKVKAKLGAEIGNKGVYRRYSRALTAIATAVNAGHEVAAAA